MSTLDLEHFTSNTELYNGWSSTYDTDGNVLPAVDEVVFNERIVPLLQAMKDDVRVLEIGCGTGRNTVKLRQILSPGSTIYAVDVSEGMMQQAKKKFEDPASIDWALLDLQAQGEELASFVGEEQVDIFISTLVLEHVALDAFFGTLSRHLKAGGWAWVSTMHPSIGDKTGAGYRRSDTGVRVRGESTNYEIEEVVEAARKYGLKLDGEVVEAGVGAEEVEAVRVFGPRARKWLGYDIFVGVLLRKA